MILVGHPFQIKVVEEVGADHLVNCENNNDYFVVNLEEKKFYNPVTKTWDDFIKG